MKSASTSSARTEEQKERSLVLLFLSISAAPKSAGFPSFRHPSPVTPHSRVRLFRCNPALHFAVALEYESRDLANSHVMDSRDHAS